MREIRDLYKNRKMHRLFSGPYLQKNFYFLVKELQGFNKLVAMGSLKFNWIILHGLAEPVDLAGNWFQSGEDVAVHPTSGSAGGNKLARRWWSIFKLQIESFEAGVSWRSPGGGQINCRLIGLSACNLGGPSSDRRNEIKIEYDSVVILHPFKQAHLNEWREFEKEQTLEFKSYLEPDCGGLSKEDRGNVTAGIDHLFMTREIRQLIVRELREEYIDWLLELVRRGVRSPK